MRSVKDPFCNRYRGPNPRPIEELYHRDSVAAWRGGYCVTVRNVKCGIKGDDEKVQLMLSVMYAEYLRTGVNRFSKREVNRLCGIDHSIRWVRDRFKLLLWHEYLLPAGKSVYDGVMLNLSKLIFEDKEDATDCDDEDV